MPAAIEQRQPRPRDYFTVGLARARRNDRVLPSPDDQRGQARYALQQMRQARAEKVRLPSQTRDLGARVLKSLELFGRAFAPVKLGQLRRVAVQNRGGKISARGDGKDVHDF